jgi:hypothetical protein
MEYYIYKYSSTNHIFPPFYNIRLSSIARIHIDVNVGNVRKSYIVKWRKY